MMKSDNSGTRFRSSSSLPSLSRLVAMKMNGPDMTPPLPRSAEGNVAVRPARQGFGVVVVVRVVVVGVAVVGVVVVVVVVVVAATGGGQIAASEKARSPAVVPVDVVTWTIVGVVVRLKLAIAPRIFELAESLPALASREQLVTSTANATL